MTNPLPPDRIGVTLARITAWRLAPELPVACPVCGAEGLIIIDQSARPFAEWYNLKCPACGLADTLHIPLAPPT